MPRIEQYKGVLCRLVFATLLAGCDAQQSTEIPAPGSQGNTDPTPATILHNAQVNEQLPLDDPDDFEDARRGLIAAANDLVVTGADGNALWDTGAYDFMEGPSPSTVNPSLWRQETLNNIAGLFEVTPGIYQIRGFDLSNMSLIRGSEGWIVVDPLTSQETAAAALAFARRHLPIDRISAVILTHSHVDHFGGVASVLEPDGSTLVVAPEGFLEEASSENILVGQTMARRSMFMYGSRLERGPRGHIGSGLGKAPALGQIGIAVPALVISQTGETHLIDGVEFEFQNAANSEAPAELTFYLPEYNAFCGAELVSRTMHNLYTLRGAKVRDARQWSEHIDTALQLFGEADIYFGSHHWPLWGNSAIREFLAKQRDGYRFIHDQTLRLAAQGHTPEEIAEELVLPSTLERSFSNRGYYGTLKHNAKAVYQRYFGWFDGNPANLDALPPVAAADRYVTLMGGVEKVIEHGRNAYAAGDYRWVAELLNHVVFTAPDNAEARNLLAATYDQLAYQAESAPWRDVYLTAALELRAGPPATATSNANVIELLSAAPLAEFMQLIGTFVDAESADGEQYVFNFVFKDVDEHYVLTLQNAVLRSERKPPVTSANATVSLTKALFLQIMTRQTNVRALLTDDDLTIEGSRLDLLNFLSMLQPPAPAFNIVTP